MAATAATETDGFAPVADLRTYNASAELFTTTTTSFSHSEVKGNYACASKDVAAGDVVLEEYPLAAVCHFLESEKLTRAARDLYFRGMDDWCRELPSGSADWHLAAALIRKGCDGEWADGYVCAVTKKAEREGAHAITWLLEQNPSLTREDVVKVYGAVARNSFTYTTFLLGHGYGEGFFPRAAMLNHSCDPNTAFMFRGRKIVFYAIRDIAKGEELTHAYQGLSLCLSAFYTRRAVLETKSGFKCECERCVSENFNGVPERLRDAYLRENLLVDEEDQSKLGKRLRAYLGAVNGHNDKETVKRGDQLLRSCRSELAATPLSSYSIVLAYARAHVRSPMTGNILDGRYRSHSVRLLQKLAASAAELCENEGVCRYITVNSYLMFFILSEAALEERSVYMVTALLEVERFYGGLACLDADVVMGGPGIREMLDIYESLRQTLPESYSEAAAEMQRAVGEYASEIDADGDKEEEIETDGGGGGGGGGSESESSEQSGSGDGGTDSKRGKKRRGSERPDSVGGSEIDDATAALKLKDLGNKAYKARKFGTAINHYENALELDPTNSVYLLNMGAVYYEQGRYDECVSACGAAVRVGRMNQAPPARQAKAYNRMAGALIQLEQYERAYTACRLSLAECETDAAKERKNVLEGIMERTANYWETGDGEGE